MGYLTGNAINERADAVGSIRIPADSRLRQALYGAIFELANSYEWETFGILTPLECAAYFQEIGLEFMTQNLFVGNIFATIAEIPDAALLCDGSSVSKDDYPRLWEYCPDLRSGNNVILPDLRDKFILGGGGIAPVSGGSKDVTLTELEMPAHTHATIPHTHTASYPSPFGTLEGVGVPLPAVNNPPLPAITSPASVDILSTGGGMPHENMPPYIALKYCVWAK
jgi:microcystin-dependent protein